MGTQGIKIDKGDIVREIEREKFNQNNNKCSLLLIRNFIWFLSIAKHALKYLCVSTFIRF